MQGFEQVFGNIFKQLFANPLKGIGTGFGIFDKIMAEHRLAQERAQREALAKQLANPNAVMARINQLQKPLDQNLILNAMNGVQAGLAERGLSQAPGLARQESLITLAPYLQHNQDAAIQAAQNEYQQQMENMGGYENGLSSPDISGLFAWLGNRGGAGSAGGGGGTSGGSMSGPDFLNSLGGYSGTTDNSDSGIPSWANPIVSD